VTGVAGGAVTATPCCVVPMFALDVADASRTFTTGGRSGTVTVIVSAEDLSPSVWAATAGETSNRTKIKCLFMLAIILEVMNEMNRSMPYCRLGRFGARLQVGLRVSGQSAKKCGQFRQKCRERVHAPGVPAGGAQDACYSSHPREVPARMRGLLTEDEAGQSGPA
jgi:hypothetical protein